MIFTNPELIKKLAVITDEEKEIVSGKGINMSRYSDALPFKVDSKKMLQTGRLFTIRPNTRFVDFPEHSHNYVEIIYMCSGSQRHIINGETTVDLKQGELLLLNQSTKHSTFAAKKDDIAVNMVVLPQFFNTALQMIGEDNKISQLLFAGFGGQNQRLSFMHFKVADVLPIQNLIENLIWSAAFKGDNYKNTDQITMGLLFLQLLSFNDRIISNEQQPLSEKVVNFALAEIEQNYQNARLSEVARVCNVSGAFVSSTLKAVTGKNFKEHLMKKRLAKAADLLKTTDISVNNIIFMVGYENTSYFYRMFFKKYGLSPKEYRISVKNKG